MARAWSLAMLLAILFASPAAAAPGSLYFGPNEPRHYDFADLPSLPAEFGRGEFTFEIWVKPDNRFPVGETSRGTIDQLTAWSATDREPYSGPGWWLPGNWLIDGHSRPRGYGPTDSRAGTFSLQFYGGGRLRWMFSDHDSDMPAGMVYAVQAPTGAASPSLLDGRWHHVAAVRRWRQPSGATLELWVDGVRVGATDIPRRVDMRVFWDKLAHPDDPEELGGWSFGAEVMTAWGVYFTQYEDYKGWIDELRLWRRALSPAELGRAARGGEDASQRGLLSRFRFEEGRGGASCDSLDRNYCMILHRMGPAAWSTDNAPVAEGRVR